MVLFNWGHTKVSTEMSFLTQQCQQVEGVAQAQATTLPLCPTQLPLRVPEHIKFILHMLQSEEEPFPKKGWKVH